MAAVPVMTIKVEQVKQVPDGRHVPGNVLIVVVITHARIGEIIAAPGSERGVDPVPFYKFHE